MIQIASDSIYGLGFNSNLNVLYATDTSSTSGTVHVYDEEGLYDVRLTVQGVGGPVEKVRSGSWRIP